MDNLTLKAILGKLYGGALIVMETDPSFMFTNVKFTDVLKKKPTTGY